MLVKSLARPLFNTIIKVPSRNTSAIVGRRTNHVSVAVSPQLHTKSISFSSFCCEKLCYFSAHLHVS